MGIASTIVVAGILIGSVLAPAQNAPASHEALARAIVAKMTLEDKIDMLCGDGFFSTRAMPKYGIPAFLMTDGPLGARLPPPSTAYAAGIGLAASWDPALAEAVGVQLGRDARSRGASFLLGPGVNLYRAPMNGRNFEYFGEDPYLASRIAVGYIRGVQSQNVSATVKHLAGNNSEFARTTSNSVIDERTLRELYLPVFEAAVKEAHVGAVMNSYNMLNGTYTAQNDALNNGILRGDWGFSGLLMSDWGSTHDGVAAARASLDLEMPNAVAMTRKVLLTAIREGNLSEAQIDRKVEHLLALAARFGWLDKPALDPTIPRYNLAGDEVALRGAEEGMVLLKNDNRILPLNAGKLHRVAVLGPNAYPAVSTAGGSGEVVAFSQSSAMAGLAEALRGKADVTWGRGVPTLSMLSGRSAFYPAPGSPLPGVQQEIFDNPTFKGTPIRTAHALSISGGEAFSAARLADMLNDKTLPEIVSLISQREKNYSRWTGHLRVDKEKSYTFFVEDSGSYRLLLDGKLLVDHSQLRRFSLWQQQLRLAPGEHRLEFHALSGQDTSPSFFRVGAIPTSDLVEQEAIQLAKAADVVVLCLGFQPEIESENMDRPFTLPPGQVELIQAVLEVNPRVIVALTSGGSVETASWLPHVSALIETWYPGQEGGKALARILLGQTNPSGHLPISWERALKDNPSIESYYFNNPEHPEDIVYREGVFTGYRGFDRSGGEPLFPFGFGLSYTDFAFNDLTVTPREDGSFRASFIVRNTGDRQGTAVPQIYLESPQGIVPEQPVKTLVAFARVEVAPRSKRSVIIDVPARALTHFDTAGRQWKAHTGSYNVLLGKSATSIDARRSFTLRRAIDLPLSSPVAAARVVAIH
jgi:beta-glucosidase